MISKRSILFLPRILRQICTEGTGSVAESTQSFVSGSLNANCAKYAKDANLFQNPSRHALFSRNSRLKVFLREGHLGRVSNKACGLRMQIPPQDPWPGFSTSMI
jgi:hypothetical protein